MTAFTYTDKLAEQNVSEIAKKTPAVILQQETRHVTHFVGGYHQPKPLQLLTLLGLFGPICMPSSIQEVPLP